MLKGFLSIILFIIAVFVLILLLVGGTLLKAIKNFRKAAEQAADKQAQRQRYETGRQRSQYSQRQLTATDNRQGQDAQQEKPAKEEARHTQTATGETIIDQRHQERENKKIFDDSDGEYVEFVEES